MLPVDAAGEHVEQIVEAAKAAEALKAAETAEARAALSAARGGILMAELVVTQRASGDRTST